MLTCDFSCAALAGDGPPSGTPPTCSVCGAQYHQEQQVRGKKITKPGSARSMHFMTSAGAEGASTAPVALSGQSSGGGASGGAAAANNSCTQVGVCGNVNHLLRQQRQQHKYCGKGEWELPPRVHCRVIGSTVKPQR